MSKAKAYLVAAGSYSDFRIIRVFLDEELAEEYVSMMGKSDSHILEYDIETDVPEPVRYCFASLNMHTDSYRFEVITDNTWDCDPDEYTYTKYSPGAKRISLKRLIHSKTFNEQELHDKYEKVCHDIHAQIKHHEAMGWTDDMIMDWVEELS